MDNVQKFNSDIEKIRKFERAQKGPEYNGENVCNQAAELFVKSSKGLETLAECFAEYWLETYIRCSPDSENEHSPENIEKLCALKALLENDTEQTSALSEKDWKELCLIVNAEAEDLPLELLSDLMTIFVDKKAY